MTEEPVRPKMPLRIETKRLIIRPPMPGDGVEMNSAIRETYEGLKLWMPWADHIPEADETEINRVRAYANYLEGVDFNVQAYLKETGEFAVGSGLHRGDRKVPSHEIGYWCRKRFQGQGYVSETVRALTRVGFEHMKANRIEIRCDLRNDASRKVAERCGFIKEAEMRNDTLGTDGSLRTSLIFAMIPEQFTSLIQEKPELYEISY